jgi:flagellar protein FliO/FliZ
MPVAKRSHGAPQATLRWTAPAIAGLAVVIASGAACASDDAVHPGAAISGRLLATPPAPFSAGSIVSTSIFTVPAAAASGSSPRPAPRGSVDGARPAGPAWLNRLARKSQGAASESWWPLMGGMALALAICGALGIAARRFSPRIANGTLQVVGRVSLSPKHTVYLLRVGRRVLLLGAGPQGAPALLGELEDPLEDSPSSQAGDEP